MTAMHACETHMPDACAAAVCDPLMHVRTYELTYADLPSNRDEVSPVSHLPDPKAMTHFGEDLDTCRGCAADKKAAS